jgi:hypothetical protein
MKNIIGEATISSGSIRFSSQSMKVYLKKSLYKLFSEEIEFNPISLTIRKVTVDSVNITKLNFRNFSFMTNEDPDRLVGLYNVIQKDEDTFVMKKIKENAQR